ncbi:sensor domain-containing protein [Aureimonas flava]|uniref:sensor domain-containing protein n=1 Tax=Aureimonas flava TaxID=2320271 RepID=UPI001459FCCC|nr:EAL domain-containing protein [Aureimonas flava]
MIPIQVSPYDVPSELQALNRGFATLAIDPDGRVLRANNRFLSMFGCELEEIVGRDVTLFVPPEEQENWARLRTRIKTGGNWSAAARRRRRDGSELWVRSHVTAVTGQDGAPIETIAILTDVTAEIARDAETRGRLAALDLSHAVLHLSPERLVIGANDVFLGLTGYRLDEIMGRHADLFADPAAPTGRAAPDAWIEVLGGRPHAGECCLVGRDGERVWLQTTFTPVLDPCGRLAKVVQTGFDVTEHKRRQSECAWQIAAIDKTHAVITFDMTGAIVQANQNFLDAFGYEMGEIEGRHHRIFVDPAFVHGAEYAAFWRHLRAGRHHAGQYKRIGRCGRPIWLHATYSPIFDMDGHPVRVVKYATIVTEERMRQAEIEGQVAAIHKSQCVISFALDGTILDANDNFLRVTGYRYAELVGRNHRMIAAVGDEADEAEAYALFWQGLAQGHHQSGEFRRVGKDGREIWLQAVYSPILDLEGRPFKVVKYALDITAAKLRHAEHQGQIQAIGRSQGVMTLALDGTILDANENFLSALGYELEEIRGRHHGMLMEAGARGGPDAEAHWAALRAGRFHTGLHCHQGKDGRRVWLQANYSPILDLAGKPFKIVALVTDVTQNVMLAEAYEDAKRQAQHDPATALPNRARLAAFMASALAQPGSSMAVLYLDLDHFKPINDTYGHVVGDRVLGEVADRVRRLLRNDQIAARLGADEFVIAAPGLDAEGAEQLCRRLASELAVPMHHGGTELPVRGSIGVALAPVDATTVDELLRCADTALARAKRDERGGYSFYAADQNERLAAHRRLLDEMRRGIRNGEFFVEFQPRFETSSRRIRGVEALVRWAHPERGRVSPAEFIPQAERSGLIIPLGEAVLRDACRTIAGFDAISVSVNVSPVQFRDPRLVEIIASALDEAGLPAHRLELEITEGILIEDAERARQTLGRLKEMGLRLAMDDFGTGYSSMSYLCDFPFDVIKIDRKFVSGLHDPGRGRAVVQAIIGLGQSLGIGVTAEGVETNDQLAMLMQLQCREVQGFLLARPMSPEALRLLESDAKAPPAEAPAPPRRPRRAG